MLVIAMESGSPGHMRWAGRRHDDDRPDASSGSGSGELFEAIFVALHDGEQVALGVDRPLTEPLGQGHDATAAGPASDDTLARLAEAAADRPGLAELAHLLGELGTWRPWTTISTSLARWKANTSILLWQAVPAAGSAEVAAPAAADSFFRQLHSAGSRAEATSGAEVAAGPVVNLAAAAARRAGLFVDPAELARPPVSITVTNG